MIEYCENNETHFHKDDVLQLLLHMLSFSNCRGCSKFEVSRGCRNLYLILSNGNLQNLLAKSFLGLQWYRDSSADLVSNVTSDSLRCQSICESSSRDSFRRWKWHAVERFSPLLTTVHLRNFNSSRKRKYLKISNNTLCVCLHTPSLDVDCRASVQAFKLCTGHLLQKGSLSGENWPGLQQLLSQSSEPCSIRIKMLRLNWMPREQWIWFCLSLDSNRRNIQSIYKYELILLNFLNL